MSKFKLRSGEVPGFGFQIGADGLIEFGETGLRIIVRQVSHGERTSMAKAERFERPELLISNCVIEPKIAIEDVTDLPGDVAQAMLDTIMELSGMGEKEGPEKKDSPPTN